MTIRTICTTCNCTSSRRLPPKAIRGSCSHHLHGNRMNLYRGGGKSGGKNEPNETLIEFPMNYVTDTAALRTACRVWTSASGKTSSSSIRRRHERLGRENRGRGGTHWITNSMRGLIYDNYYHHYDNYDNYYFLIIIMIVVVAKDKTCQRNIFFCVYEQ